jgi:hypothetical protein
LTVEGDVPPDGKERLSGGGKIDLLANPDETCRRSIGREK